MIEPIKRRNQTAAPMRAFRLTSKLLVRISLGLWLASLPFTGLVLYADQRELRGFEILAMGWLGLLTLNFAWLANPIFLLILSRISAQRKSVGMAAMGLLLAFDTVRLSRMLLNEGGGASSVYGYGWGAVLWFAAMCLGLAAAGTLEIERESEVDARGVHGNANSDSIAARFAGLALAILAIGVAGVLSYWDRSHANQAELLRLHGLAFKRGAVCAAPEPKAQYQVDISNGVVEVIVENGALSAYPFNGPKQLLAWGLPRVRFDDRDYYLEQLDGNLSTVSDAASATPVAQLFVSSGRVDDRSQITAKLVAVGLNLVVFSQTWQAETKSGDRFCPEFSSFPGADIQPRKLVMEAVGGGKITPKSLPSVAPAKASEISRVTASIVGIKESAGRPIPTGRGGWIDNRPEGSLGWRNNRDCPKDVGWSGASVKHVSARLDTGWPFRIGEKAYYLGSRDEYNALCQGQFVYLSTTSARDGKNFINIEKRSLADFRLAWRAIVVIDKQITPYPRNRLKLSHVAETDTGITLAVVNEDDWTEIDMTTPVVAAIRR